jgi:hypothetical protein
MSRTPIYGPRNSQSNLLGFKLRMRGPQNHVWTAVAKVAA